MAAELKIGIGADASNLRNELKQAEQDLTQFVKAIEGIGALGQKFKTLGRDLSVGLTLPLVAIATAALKTNEEVKKSMEGLASATKSSFSTLGDIIQKNFNVSGLIDKLSTSIEKLTSWFDDLSPTMQKVVLTIGGIVAAAGPLIAAVGTLMAMLPAGLTLMGALSGVFAAITGPIGLTVIAITALSTAYIVLKDNTKTAADYQQEWANALRVGSREAATQVSALDALYKKTQDTTLSTKQRTEAVNELQRLYPKYFNNIKDEIILNGGAQQSYVTLRGAIINASKARAAGALLDKRSNDLLISQEQRKVELAQQMQKVLNLQEAQRKGQKTYDVKYNEIATGFSGTVFVDEQLKIQKENARILIQAYKDEYSGYLDANKDVLKILNANAQDLANTTAKAPDVVIPAIKGAVEKINAKSKELKIELPTIEPLAQSFNSQLENALGERFATLLDYENREKELHARMTNNNVGLLATMSQSAIDMAARVAEFNNAVSQTLNQGVTDMIADGAMALGDALATGENVIGAVGKSLLSTFAGILVQLGKMAIAEGVALKAIQLGLKSLNPYVAIAAGVALVALGSAMSSSVSGLGNSFSGGNSNSGGGGISSGSGSGSANYTSSYSSGSSGGEVRFFISGNDLVGVLNRQIDKNTRIGG